MFMVVIDIDGYHLKPRRENGVGLRLIGTLPFPPTNGLRLFPETALAKGSDVRVELREVTWRIKKKRSGNFLALGTLDVLQDKDASAEAIRAAFEPHGWTVVDPNE